MNAEDDDQLDYTAEESKGEEEFDYDAKKDPHDKKHRTKLFESHLISDKLKGSIAQNLNTHEIDHRVEMLRRTSREKRKCLKMVGLNVLVTLVFLMYFTYIYVFHKV